MVSVENGTVITSTDDALTPVIAFTERKDIPETDRNPLLAILKRGAKSRMDSLEASRKSSGKPFGTCALPAECDDRAQRGQTYGSPPRDPVRTRSRRSTEP